MQFLSPNDSIFLPYMKLLHNDYIIFIRLFAGGTVQSLSLYGSITHLILG